MSSDALLWQQSKTVDLVHSLRTHNVPKGDLPDYVPYSFLQQQLWHPPLRHETPPGPL